MNKIDTYPHHPSPRPFVICSCSMKTSAQCTPRELQAKRESNVPAAKKNGGPTESQKRCSTTNATKPPIYVKVVHVQHVESTIWLSSAVNARTSTVSENNPNQKKCQMTKLTKFY